ncbi:MAG: dTDP-4-dehydrorhamnose reductase [Tannerella sp.]|jgi:dTDP-4-dehydrorhamnose reductase|nr:dTDP-4-dehydrorhamnose reductase [Tannerella sp.]
MNKGILVTGANGQLGHAIRALAPKHSDYVFHFTDTDTLDICDRAQLTDFVRSHPVRYLLNCAAYTAVDKAEDDVETCMRINRDAVRNIGEVAWKQGVKVIHISTDYVFDGNSAHPYGEEESTNPKSTYGLSKQAGEITLLQACPESVIIRSAWLYSEFGANFVKTMLRLGSEREEVNVVSDQIGTPTYAGDLAAAMLAVVEHPSFVGGIYHYAGEGVCSWYDFAVQIMALAGLNCRIRPVTTPEYPTRAVRPAYSVLSKEKIKQVYHVEVPDWKVSLRHCINKIKETGI